MAAHYGVSRGAEKKGKYQKTILFYYFPFYGPGAQAKGAYKENKLRNNFGKNENRLNLWCGHHNVFPYLL